MSEWQLLSPNGAPNPGAPVSGGGGTPLVGARDILDARRSAMTPRTPNAEYPDGYLGQVQSRREDRLLQNVQARLTQRNYQRGVHKGERVDQSDYFWNAKVNPMAGLEAQARGQRWTAVGSTAVEQINHMGKNHLLPPEELDKVAAGYGVVNVIPVDPVRQASLKHLLPQWG